MTKGTALTSSNGLVTVRRTMFGQEAVSEETIDIRPFATDPARIRVGRGLTIGLPNYSSARVDVSIELPCYVEEAVKVYEELTQKVEVLVEEEAKKILQLTSKSDQPAKAATLF